MAGRFAAWRVRPAHQLSAGKTPLAACWLLAEWPEDAAQPVKYFFSNRPASTSLKKLVDTAKSRWWVEHSYRELKDELGLDHFEGRSWRGWNRHVALVLMAYAFLQDVRRRRPQKWRAADPPAAAGGTPVAAGVLVCPLPGVRTNRARTSEKAANLGWNP